MLIALLVLSGIGTAISAGLFPIICGGSGDPLPKDFSGLLPRMVHGIVACLLILLLAMHIAAALYHQLFLRDGLFKRMWFGKRD